MASMKFLWRLAWALAATGVVLLCLHACVAYRVIWVYGPRPELATYSTFERIFFGITMIWGLIGAAMTFYGITRSNRRERAKQ